jgi:hypothetical protein
MRTSLASIRTAAAVGFVALGAAANATTVFDNTATQQPLFLPLAYEYGDEYRLTFGETLDSFQLGYWGSQDVAGTATITIYANDGAPVAPGSPSPGTALFADSVAVASGYNYFEGLNLSTFGVVLPSRVTIAVEFDLTDGVAGLTLSDNPEAIGLSPDDYWGNPAGVWGLYGDPTGKTVYDFTAKIGVVPEGSTWLSIAGVAAIAGVGAYRRFRK